jgi:hypothetical protein
MKEKINGVISGENVVAGNDAGELLSFVLLRWQIAKAWQRGGNISGGVKSVSASAAAAKMASAWRKPNIMAK